MLTRSFMQTTTPTRLGIGCIALLLLAPLAARGQTTIRPDTVVVRSGALRLRGLLWRPPAANAARSPALLFNHGGYETSDSAIMLESSATGALFARHGYVVLVLYRQGVGLSVGQDSSGLDRMVQARLRGGQPARNIIQLQLLQGPELDQAMAGLRLLREQPDVDTVRIGLVGHSFGGSLSLLLAARDTMIRAVVTFAAAGLSWDQSPELRAALKSAVTRTRAVIFFNHAANDYSTAAGPGLAAELKRLSKPHMLRIYPAVGRTTRDGHNLVYRDPPTWEDDVVSFLRTHLSGRAPD